MSEVNTPVFRPRVAVVVPVYKEGMSNYEEISYRRCLNVFHNHDIIIVSPFGLDVQHYLLPDRDWEIRRFDARYFRGIRQYNRLMLSSSFYKEFYDYTYILIHQLDAFVFKDDLVNWCSKGYDYIGAPWLDGVELAYFPFRGSRFVRGIIPFGNRTLLCFVGNGGFSLRNVRSCARLIDANSTVAKFWRANEDFFFSRHGARFDWFDIPGPDIALDFSFEKRPRECFKQNQRRLPFGCHAWEKWDIDFWKPIFYDFGYIL
jgi:hypothetical protein